MYYFENPHVDSKWYWLAWPLLDIFLCYKVNDTHPHDSVLSMLHTWLCYKVNIVHLTLLQGQCCTSDFVTRSMLPTSTQSQCQCYPPDSVIRSMLHTWLCYEVNVAHLTLLWGQCYTPDSAIKSMYVAS